MTQSADFAENFAPFSQKMRDAGLADIVIDTFAHYYRQLLAGETGNIAEADIVPVETLPDSEAFSADLTNFGRSVLSQTVLLKLNGGLGTSMGLAQAKSSLVVKNGLTFLDIIAQKAIQDGVPLVLMNSFATRPESLAILEKYPELQNKIPLDFVQNKSPKIARADLSPASWAKDPNLEWHPPGHGEIYTVLVQSNMLAQLLDAGYKYAFVANSDNLGAEIDPAILGYFAKNDIPFMMEVADRTEIDRKGGHLTSYPNGQLVLRESAQCPPNEMDTFQDITKHKFFNTNNLWLNLAALKAMLDAKDNILGLPMIRNAKTVDPRDKTSTPVWQLETAMGAAIAVFADAQAVRVPRHRFAPVKTTNDLFRVRSDIYQLTADSTVEPNPERTLGSIFIDLDTDYYKMIADLDARIPHGVPSLLHCERLIVHGDVKFGANVTLKGRVELINQTGQQVTIADGQTLEGKIVF